MYWVPDWRMGQLVPAAGGCCGQSPPACTGAALGSGAGHSVGRAPSRAAPEAHWKRPWSHSSCSCPKREGTGASAGPAPGHHWGRLTRPPETTSLGPPPRPSSRWWWRERGLWQTERRHRAGRRDQETVLPPDRHCQSRWPRDWAPGRYWYRPEQRPAVRVTRASRNVAALVRKREGEVVGCRRPVPQCQHSVPLAPEPRTAVLARSRVARQGADRTAEAEEHPLHRRRGPREP